MRVVLLASLCVTIQSCVFFESGDRLNNQFDESGFCEIKAPFSDGVYSQINRLNAKGVEFQKLYRKKTGQQIKGLYALDFGLASHSNPLIYGPVTFKSKLQAIKTQMSELDARIHGYFFENAELDLTKEELKPHRTKFMRWLGQFESMQRLTNRLKSRECSRKLLLSNKARDIRPYLYFHHFGASKLTQLMTEHFHEKELHPEVFEHASNQFIELCERDSTRRDFQYCYQQLNMALGKKSLFRLFTRYAATSKTIFEDTFKLMESKKHVRCEQGSQGLEIHVPFARLDKELQGLVTDALNRYWVYSEAGKNVKILPIFQTSPLPGQVRILKLKGSHSFVPIKRRDKIYLGMNRNRQQLVAVLAHEFGHTLGFDDCYLEFMDLDKRQVVNYRFDDHHLMCNSSIGGNIPYESWRELVKKTCHRNL